MLIEEDKRGDFIRLLYKEEQFAVPKNVHIIGMMNTADRSLAMIDYALRRRFAFFDLVPAFQSDGFKTRQGLIANPKFNSLIAVVERLNNAIGEDVSLGDGFKIGHSYFCANEDEVTDEWLSNVVKYELTPLLNEYWFDEPSKTADWVRQLRGAVNG
jgi:5-methylcytosine-specific restriction protein B